MQTLWMGSIQSALTHPASCGFHGNRHMFHCVMCGGAVPYTHPLSGKSGYVSLPSFSSDWARPGASLFSFQVTCRDKCPRPLSKILNCGSPWRHRRLGPKTLGKVVEDQKLSHRPLSCSHLAPRLGWVLRAMR